MRISIGLPSTIPGTPGSLVIEWAKRAEEAGFSTLTTVDRIAYPSYESIVALAGAAGATREIGLLTNIILAPTRNPVLLAKEAASLDQLSGGRFVLGVGVGSREDDYELSEQQFNNRGKRLDEALDLMQKIWRGEEQGSNNRIVSPIPVNNKAVPILIGGMTQAALDRMVRYGAGWTVGGAPLDRTLPFIEKVREAWQSGGREGQPRLVALQYFALGDNAQERAAEYLSDYYGPWGRGMAAAIPKSADALAEVAGRFKEAGFDELNFNPAIAEIGQLEGLAKAVLG